MNETNIKLNINNEKYKDNRDMANITDYYRKKIESFDQERIDWLNKIEKLRLTLEDHHKLEWELQTRENEILNLQLAKNEVTKGLNIERKKVLEYSTQVEFHKERSTQDRRRLMQLLELVNPIEQQIKLQTNKKPEYTENYEKLENLNRSKNKLIESSIDFKRIPVTVDLSKSTNLLYENDQQIKNCNPSKFSDSMTRSNTVMKRLNSPSSISNNNHNSYANEKNERSRSNSKQKCQRGRQTTGKSRPSSANYKKIKNTVKNETMRSTSGFRIKNDKIHVIRSLVFPNNQKSDLHEEVAFLQKQISEIRSYFEDLLTKQAIQSKIHEEELQMQVETLKVKNKEILEAKQKSEEMCIHLTKDILQLKGNYPKIEKQLYEELDYVKLQNQALITAMKELSICKDLDKKNYLSEQERINNLVLGGMREKLKNYQENVRIMKEQYRQIQNIFSSRMNELISKYNDLNGKNRELEDKLRIYQSGGNMKKRNKASDKNFDNLNMLVSEINDLEKRLKIIEAMDFSKKNDNNEIDDSKTVGSFKSKSGINNVSKSKSSFKKDRDDSNINLKSQKDLNTKFANMTNDQKEIFNASNKLKIIKSKSLAKVPRINPILVNAKAPELKTTKANNLYLDNRSEKSLKKENEDNFKNIRKSYNLNPKDIRKKLKEAYSNKNFNKKRNNEVDISENKYSNEVGSK